MNAIRGNRSKAYAYARVSSESQAERGTSIKSQLELMRKYAKENGITIVKEFIDEAESATTDQRPRFQEMISLCRDNVQGVDSILVWKLSRFARNRIDSVVYKKLLSKQGIRVISVSEPIQDTPEGRVLEAMIEIIDSYYLEILSKESMRGLIQTAQLGYHTGGRPPYGYRLEAVPVGNSIKKIWQIEPKEAEAVKLIYQMHSEGYKYDEIIEKLEKKKYKPRNQNKWMKSSISEVLRKHCYSGTHYFNIRKRKELGQRVHLRDEKDRSEWIAVKVPKIVDDDIFKAVKDKMAGRRFESTRKRTSQILTGLMVCGKCQDKYVIGNYYRGKYPYYRCSTKMKKGKAVCDNRNLRGDEIDSIILHEATEIIFSRENLQKYRDLIDESVREEKKEIQDMLNRLIKDQKEIDNKKRVYYEGLESGKLDMEIVSERLEELKSQEEEITQQRLEAEKRYLEIPETEKYILTKKEYHELKESLKTFIEEATPQQKHLFLSKFINSVTVYPEKISVEYFPPVFKNQKSPGKKPQSFLVTELASPTGFEPVSQA